MDVVMAFVRFDRDKTLMNCLGELRAYVRALFQKEKLDRELEDELRFHVEMEAQARIAEGMTPTQAKEAALRRFGGVDQIKERCRDTRRVAWLEDLWGDIRFAMRILQKAPGLSLIAVSTLAIGIGANTATFSALDRFVLRPLWGTGAQRMLQINELNTLVGGTYNASVPVFCELLLQTNVFRVGAAAIGTALNLQQEDRQETIRGVEMTSALFQMVGVQPLIGRAFSFDEGTPGKARVLILGFDWWQRKFGGDPAVVGRTIVLSSHSYTVVGVMPREFSFPFGRTEACFYTPRVFGAEEAGDPLLRKERNWTALFSLQEQVSADQATVVVETISRRLQNEFPELCREWAVQARPAQQLFMPRELKDSLWGVQFAVSSILLLTCANISNLLLGRCLSRRKELSVRMALGAGRLRIVRQLLAESSVLALLGGGIGVLLAAWGLYALNMAFADLPRLRGSTVDWSLCGHVLVLTFVVALAVGLIPAWLMSRTRLADSLKDSAPVLDVGTQRLSIRNCLAIVQIALATVVLMGAALMIRSVANLLRVNPGCDPHGLVRVLFEPPPLQASDFAGLSRAKLQYIQAMGTRLRNLPGVEASAYGGTDGGFLEFDVEGHAKPMRLRLESVGVSTNAYDSFFQTMRIPLLGGRTLSVLDGFSGQNAVVVNRELARACWPQGNALGKHISFDGRPWAVVGVVENVLDWRRDAPPTPTLYAPVEREKMLAAGAGAQFMIRTTTDALAFAKVAQNIALEMVPRTRLADIFSVEAELTASMQLRRTYMWFLNAFGALGVTLAMIGLYGVLSYGVAQRTREIGVRIALGAVRKDIVGMVLRSGLILQGVGLLIGIGASFLLTTAARSVLFGISAADPLAVCIVILTSCVTGLMACWLPAWRATQVDPMTALRCD